MKRSKVYLKNGQLIVCFKGSHYIAPGKTKVKHTHRVPVIVGEMTNTVIVNGNETWLLKGSYTGQSKIVLKASRKVAPVTPSHTQGVMEMIGVVSTSSAMRCLLETCYQNWLRGCMHLQLFQKIEFADPKLAKTVQELGRQIMALHA